MRRKREKGRATRLSTLAMTGKRAVSSSKKHGLARSLLTCSMKHNADAPTWPEFAEINFQIDSAALQAIYIFAYISDIYVYI